MAIPYTYGRAAFSWIRGLFAFHFLFVRVVASITFLFSTLTHSLTSYRSLIVGVFGYIGTAGAQHFAGIRRSF
jgi:hypothetical protein